MNIQSKKIDQSKLIALGFDITKLKNTRRGRPPALTPEQEKIVIELLEAGFTVRSIAESIGINRNTIFSIKDRYRETNKDAA